MCYVLTEPTFCCIGKCVVLVRILIYPSFWVDGVGVLYLYYLYYDSSEHFFAHPVIRIERTQCCVYMLYLG